jgi:xanthine dehydrogenase YagS FAD-binding subunit
MNSFEYLRAPDVASALRLWPANTDAKFLAGGTNLIDLMREEVEAPASLIDISRLPLSEVRESPAGGGVRIGALVKNSHLAANPLIADRYPLLSSAILHGASAQLRNMATTGGNLMQRTRCLYFYDTASRCNKRSPGSGCDAANGFHRMHAILGTSPHCFASHPSDMCVALTALDAQVNISGPTGERTVPIREFHNLPGSTPHIETALQPGELIVSVDLPEASANLRSLYRKVRDRASYAFALVSVGVAARIENGVIQDLRIAMGGVGTKPWRASAAEAVLRGSRADEEQFRKAADAELAPATPGRDNAFKVELARRTLVSVLSQVVQP